MPPYSLLLSAKGFDGKTYSLVLNFKTNTFYSQNPVQGKKTIYQILFEYFVNNRVVNVNAISAEFKQLGRIGFDKVTIKSMMDRIQEAAGAVPSLSHFSFKKLSRGGARFPSGPYYGTGRLSEEAHSRVINVILRLAQLGNLDLQKIKKSLSKYPETVNLLSHPKLSTFIGFRVVSILEEGNHKNIEPVLTGFIQTSLGGNFRNWLTHRNSPKESNMPLTKSGKLYRPKH